MSSYSDNLLLENPVPGDPAVRNVWGIIENTGRSLVDTAITGVLPLSVAGSSNVILTSIAGAADQSRFRHYTFTGVLTGNITVFWPQFSRTFSVRNNTTGAFTLSLAVNNGAGAPAGAVVVVPQGYTIGVWSDGTNINQQIVGLSIEQTGNALSSLALTNNSAGTGAGSRGYFANSAAILETGILGTGYTPAGMFRSSGGYVRATGAGGLSLITGAAQPIYFGTNDADRMHLTSAGDLVFGSFDANPVGNNVNGVAIVGGQLLYVNRVGGVPVAFGRSNDGDVLGVYRAGVQVGSISVSAGATAFNTTSDERLKNFDVPQRNWRDEILAIEVREFTWRADGEPGFGISAQQTYEHFPFAISKPDDPNDMWQADYAKLAPLALRGVQDIYRQNDALREQIRLLMARVDALENR